MKKLVAMLLAGAMVFSMAACGNNGNNDASDSTKGTDSQKEEGNGEAASDGDVEAELGVYWWGSQTRAEQTQQILDMYAEEHPGITFNTMPGQWSDYWTKLSTDAAGQSIPDLVAMDYKYINQFVSNGSLLNLDPYVEDGTLNLDDVDEKIINTGRSGEDNGLYAVCSGTNAPTLLYNTGIVEEAGVEITDNMDLDTFMDVCKTIYEKTGVHTRLQYRSETYLQYILRGNGAKLYNDENNGLGCTVDDLEAYFDIFAKGTEEGWLIPQTVFTEIDVNAVEQDPLVYYTSPENQSWCGLVWSNQATAFTNAAPEGVTLALTQWSSKDNKKANYIKPSQFWSVSSWSKTPAEAVKVVDYITNSVDANNVLLAEKGIPISKKVSEAITPNLDKVQQQVATFLNDVVAPNSSDLDPAAPATAAEMFTRCDELVEAVCFGQTTPAEAAQSLFDAGNDILAAGN